MTKELKAAIVTFWIAFVFLCVYLLYSQDLTTPSKPSIITIHTPNVSPQVSPDENLLANTPQEKYFQGTRFQTGYENHWYTLYDQLEHRPFIISGDYLIVGTNSYGPRAQVYAFNYQTGEETILYNEFTDRLYINQIKQIDNTLFFSTGGYLAMGGLYYIDFPLEKNKVMKIAEVRNGDIEEREGRYWISGGDGDVCISFSSYSLLDPKNKTVTHIAEAGNDCGTGNSIIRTKDRAINLYFEGVGDGTSSIYTHVTWYDLNNPSKELPLVSKEQMPKNISDIQYNKKDNSLFLRSSKKYIFDLNNNTLIEKDFLDPIPSSEISSLQVDPIEKLRSLELPSKYRIIAENGKVL